MTQRRAPPLLRPGPPCATATFDDGLSLGQWYAGGYFIGLTRENGIRYRNIVASREHEFVGKLCESRHGLQQACSRVDSVANTKALLGAGPVGSKAALRVTNLNIAGYTDWAIPARDVLELCYRHLKPTREANDVCDTRYPWQGENPSAVTDGWPYTASRPAKTSVAMFREGGPQAFGTTRWYATSSVYDARDGRYVWAQWFGSGRSSIGWVEGNTFAIRPVRRERLGP